MHCAYASTHVMITVTCIHFRRTAVQRGTTFEEFLPVFISPATWLHFVHEIAVPTSQSPQHSWRVYYEVLAKTRSAQWVTLLNIGRNASCTVDAWLCITSRPTFFIQGDLVRSDFCVCLLSNINFVFGKHCYNGVWPWAGRGTVQQLRCIPQTEQHVPIKLLLHVGANYYLQKL